MPGDWSHAEVEAAVSDYFEMLLMELCGVPFNKAEHNRSLQRFLPNRTRGSVERKHQNISAVLIALGYPYVEGYKPLGNYQDLLYRVIEERLPQTTELLQAISADVEQKIEKPPIVSDLLSILIETPRRDDDKPKLYDRVPQVRAFTRKNYLEIESRNKTLGLAGEKLVLEYEHKRLWESGKKELANRIEHASEITGDYLGYDIRSFETDGRDRLIEVKTTQFGAFTPFFASKNEVTVSEISETSYQLYRLFNFIKQPKLFVLPGSLRNTCTLDPTQFTALPR
jgi:hypothetical protein